MDSPTPLEPAAVAAEEREPTQAEKVGKVADWIVAGLRASQLAGEWHRAGWGELSPADAVEIAEAAHEIIRADARILAELETSKAFARMNDLYARSLEIQDMKTALRVQTQINAIVARVSAAQAMAEDDDE